MAFTTTVGAGGTSLIGTSGVDTTTFAPGTVATAVFIGAQDSNDFVTLQTNQATNYTVRGGNGVDTITAAGFRSSLVTGDEGNDLITVTGTIQTATVSGLNGVDTIAVQNINGGIVNGNNGNDVLSSGQSAASSFTNNGKLVGGQGDDAITLGAGAAVTLTSGVVNGQDGNDTITITNVLAMTLGGGATIYGGQGSDTITASANATNVGLVISGDLGADNITGSAAAATNAAGDTIFGGDGDDRITGRGGADSMIGGAGLDTFTQTGDFSVDTTAVTAGTSYTFGNGVDIITDFTSGLNGDILAMGSGAVAATTATAANLAAASVVNRVYAASGNFASGVFTFTFNGSGSDTLLVTGDGANAIDAMVTGTGTANNAVILSGVNIATLTGSNFS